VACCEACSTSPAQTRVPLLKVRPPSPRRGGAERSLTVAAIGLAGAFIATALAVMAIGPSAGLVAWLPLHLVLAGAAPTAIAGVMPFFSSAVAGAPPAHPAIRLAGIAGVALGALLVTAGWASVASLGTAGGAVAALGGTVYLGGLVAVPIATLLPLRAALGPRRVFMGAIYGIALVNVLIGAAVATLFVAGWQPVLAAWATLKPAHAWLNLFGFISLVVVGSLLHLLPTVVGARIRRTRASMLAFGGLAGGPPLVALGFALALTPLALLGCALLLAGVAGIGWHTLLVMRSRANWTTDPDWHRLTTWSLVAAIAWFGIGATIAVAQVAAGGASPVGWRLAPLIAPLGIGWVAQVLVGSWSHLLPAIGPGTPEQHARQRRILGRGASARLLVLNAGILALVLAEILALPVLASAGLIAIAAAGVAALGLLVAATWPVIVSRRSPTVASEGLANRSVAATGGS
jgi:nitrite reductase (NO-forming)